MTPTARSKMKLESEGWLVAVVERWNPHGGVRQDLFGFADLLAIRGSETLAVQSTTGEHVSHRLKKIRSVAAAALWLASPARKIMVHGWRKAGLRGKAKTWQCREVMVSAGQAVEGVDRKSSPEAPPIFSAATIFPAHRADQPTTTRRDKR